MESRLQSIKSHMGETLFAKLQDPNVIEIMLNPDGQLWVEQFGEPMCIFGSMQPAQASLFMKAVAGYHNVTISDEKSILECELPLDGSRFEGIYPPVTKNPAFTIRKKALKVFTLKNYIENNILTEHQYTTLLAAIRTHKNILIVGGTGSGKTTFANALIDTMVQNNPDERIVIMEDTNELQCTAPNSVILRSNEHTSINRLLRATLRLRPDRILVGEVRGGEALELLKGWNTGHPGGIATIHADSAAQGLHRLEDLLSEATPNVNKAMIASTINVVVFIKKHPSGRRIEEVIQVTGYESNQYQYQQLA
ncbi:P-type conjugative transfer ATPase TrbB [Shewanella khirikhana]|uniref:Type IV secretion system protein PtlH n=1 Tax=Shewanella khirikhana TaxID=1965282 RepID=A0ABM8HK43_9GAMM|nr:P-type conjugative transfer ATPase TrbB [Shewanella khirikhana]AZQ13319.1 Type IV secretion system protein PtlH [Shewanella khirikhana]